MQHSSFGRNQTGNFGEFEDESKYVLIKFLVFLSEFLVSDNSFTMNETLDLRVELSCKSCSLSIEVLKQEIRSTDLGKREFEN